jgi:hypothetical protein
MKIACEGDVVGVVAIKKVYDSVQKLRNGGGRVFLR